MKTNKMIFFFLSYDNKTFNEKLERFIFKINGLERFA